VQEALTRNDKGFQKGHMNLVLVGFMASGKSTVGRRIARKLGYCFLDTDQFIEREMGCTIAELFATKGESYFRAIESRLARGLVSLHNTVISTGGGMAISPGNLDALKLAGRVVFLKAAIEDIIKRLERDTRRPKIAGTNLRETVERLYAERMPVYLQCEIVVETASKSLGWVAGEVIRRVAEQTVREVSQPAANLSN
jgi:shikimate kinase